MRREAFIRKCEGNGQSKAYHRSPKQERELARRGGGRVTPGSGRGNQKGDVKKYGGVIRIEAKCTQAKSFSITRDMLEKIEEAALPNGEIPAIVVEFLDKDGNPVQEVAVVPTYVLDAIAGDNADAKDSGSGEDQQNDRRGGSDAPSKIKTRRRRPLKDR